MLPWVMFGVSRNPEIQDSEQMSAKFDILKEYVPLALLPIHECPLKINHY